MWWIWGKTFLLDIQKQLIKKEGGEKGHISNQWDSEDCLVQQHQKEAWRIQSWTSYIHLITAGTPTATTLCCLLSKQLHVSPHHTALDITGNASLDYTPKIPQASDWIIWDLWQSTVQAYSFFLSCAITQFRPWVGKLYYYIYIYIFLYCSVKYYETKHSNN